MKIVKQIFKFIRNILTRITSVNILGSGVTLEPHKNKGEIKNEHNNVTNNFYFLRSLNQDTKVNTNVIEPVEYQKINEERDKNIEIDDGNNQTEQGSYIILPRFAFDPEGEELWNKVF